ncbi:hypothetical protein [Pinirhizobacter soli]|uniref:hypothetical protein n=1 Tax=Pinirhizobacter soli TaxID=2786953 RepID=UPI002029B684|nr:hypothetical protein [Pinirhizobacter soli]
MKAAERRTLERRRAVWDSVLERLNRVGPESDSFDDIDAFGQVKDYVLDRRDALDNLLVNSPEKDPRGRHRKSFFNCPQGNDLPGADRTAHNGIVSGADHG